MDIQNPGLGEHRLRDLNDEINKLIREKGHWEARILELGGPNYAKTAPKVTDEDGKEVRKEEPVVARCLSLCAWECDWFHFSCVTWICGAVCFQGSTTCVRRQKRPSSCHALDIRLGFIWDTCLGL
jgi:hypothetical protein